MNFLNKMKEIIPFEAIEKILIERNVYKPNKGKTGRLSISLKILMAHSSYKAYSEGSIIYIKS